METSTHYLPRMGIRRSDPREDVRWPGWWEEGRGPAIPGKILDVSASGLFLQSLSPRDPPKAGTRVHVRISCPPLAADIDVEGEVRWCGLSAAHGCVGFGVELDRVNVLLDRYLRGFTP